MKKNYLIIFLTIILGFSINLKAQPQLYGIIEQGGANGYGTLFKYDVQNNTIIVKNNFDAVGGNPTGKLVLAKNGKFYGTVRNNDTYQSRLFEYDPTTEITSLKAEFDIYTTGNGIYQNIILLNDGNLAGVCYTGGANMMGTIWKYNITMDTIIKLYDFDSISGNPSFGLFQASNGNLYGTSNLMSYPEAFTKFYEYEIATGTFNTIHEQNQWDNAGIKITEVNGKLFGTLWWTGSTGGGNVFEYDINTQTYTERACLQNLPVVDSTSQIGYTPTSGLSLATNGLLYGVNANGGTGQGLMFPNSGGTLFSFNPQTGAINKLHDFDYHIDGEPHNPVMQASDGNLYGMTRLGSNMNGSIFRYNLNNNTYDTLINFDYYTTGAWPSFTDLTELTPFNPVCDNLIINKDISNIACIGGNNGAIDITVTGATSSNVSFLWSTGSVTEDVSGLEAGNYSVKVTVNDANMCEKTEYIRIYEPTINTKSIVRDLTNGTVSITAEEVFDERFGDCGIVSMSVNPNTFTCSNVGSNVVNFTAKDVKGNVYYKKALVKINGTPEYTVDISQDYTVAPCPGKGLALIANTYMENNYAPTSYLWNNGQTTQSITAEASGVYSATLTFSNNCTVTKSYNYDATINSQNYSILAENDIVLSKKSVVKTGGIGVNSYEGSIKIENHSTVTGNNTFAKAMNITTKSGGLITNKYDSLPAYAWGGTYHYNPSCYDGQTQENKRIRKNKTVTLADSVYGDIFIERGATVIFPNEYVYANSITTENNVTIKFGTCSKIALCGDLTLGEQNKFNPENKSIELNSTGGKITLAKGTNVFGSFTNYSSFTSIGDPKNRNSITGIVVTNSVYAEYSDFNINTECNNCSSIAMENNLLQNIENAASLEQIDVYPNPADGNFNLSIHSSTLGAVKISATAITGQVLFETLTENTSGALLIPINLSHLNDGIYFVSVQIGNSITTKKVVISK